MLHGVCTSGHIWCSCMHIMMRYMVISNGAMDTNAFDTKAMKNKPIDADAIILTPWMQSC